MANEKNNDFLDVLDVTTSNRDSLSTSSMPSTKNPDCIVIRQKRRSFTAEERLALVEESFLDGETVSSVARRHGIAPSLLFKWRSQQRQGSLVSIQSDQAVVPISQYTKALDEIKRLQRLLGRSAAEKAILEEALEIARAKKWLAR